MSTDIALYKPIYVEGEHGKASQEMYVTSFYGGQKHGRGVQFTIGKHYTMLSEKQTRHLIALLSKRVALGIDDNHVMEEVKP